VAKKYSLLTLVRLGWIAFSLIFLLSSSQVFMLASPRN